MRHNDSRRAKECCAHWTAGSLAKHRSAASTAWTAFTSRPSTRSRIPQVAKAFDLSVEPQSVRDKYGPGHRGACYLVGRKLMEAGVRFVTVDTLWPLTAETPGGFIMNWDHHDLIYAPGSCGTVRDKAGGEGRYGIGHWVMTGSMDRAFAALIDDLDERGLLAETLVCLVSEFGRTPRLNKFAGRDHWTETYSIVMAGAGVPGGQIVGKSDADGGYAIEDPHTPEEYGVTIYEKLGIDRDVPLYDATNRPDLLRPRRRADQGGDVAAASRRRGTNDKARLWL